MNKKLSTKFWASMLIFGLIGQVAWVVENMYFNVFIYKMFHASAADISLMVGASSVAATVTTVLMGALSDTVGRRKLLICLGYILWGISILSFALIRVDLLTPLAGSTAAAFSLGITLVIIMDCVMTFFGSTANDAAYNAWLTDMGDASNRGRIEGFNSMMPLVSILVVFGGFMGFNLDLAESWTLIFLIIGGVVLLIGILGFFLIEDTPVTGERAYWKTVTYSFRPSVLLKNRLLYAVLGAYAVFGISIQIFMPYLILYYEQSLQMTGYVLIMAPAIIIAAVITAFYGKLYDMMGFKGSVIPSTILLMLGYVILFFTRTTVPVFIGSLLMMTGYMTGMAVYGAMIRDHIPEQRAGQFQGIRIIGQVLIPGIIGPAIGAWVLRDAELITNNDGTTSFLPHQGIWMAAFLAAVVLCIVLWLIFRMTRNGFNELLNERKPGGWTLHPRPQMRREKWCSLNGEWTLNMQKIQVPFAPQSVLSGYKGRISRRLSYERSFIIPVEFTDERILLHLDAVDQICDVYVNEKQVGHHEGGYLPFVFDITDKVIRGGENRLRVEAVDTLSHTYPYGKQCRKRGGMWYTPFSGIWQNVWMENVPAQYIEKVKITPDLTGIQLTVEGADQCQVSIELPDGSVMQAHPGRIEIPEEQRVLWTPVSPYLYAMRIIAGEDRVESYFALRTVAIQDCNGVQRVCLNGKPIFLHGVLDQGYYADGIYLPAEEAEYDRDVLRMKQLGYNLLRKHIKVEPEAFYYACDRLGMLVMQDMVNNGSYNFIRDTALPTVGFKKRRDDHGSVDTPARRVWIEHSRETIQHLYNHPSIIAYTIFNEGWGQFHSDAMYEKVKQWDPTRLVDSTSGWFAQSHNDFDSEHIYFKAIELHPGKRPLFVTECGGYSMPVEGHYYSKYSQYGYGACSDSKELTAQIDAMYRKMILPGISKGVCGCIYTQLSDVEDEINGLYTYDRKVCKVEEETMRKLAEEINEKLM